MELDPAVVGYGPNQRQGTGDAAAGNGVELVQMNFSFPPGRPKAGPILNFRLEVPDFSKSGRCLIGVRFIEYVDKK